MHPYRPHPLLPSGHLQTLMVGLSSGVRPPHHALLMELPLPDGEGLALAGIIAGYITTALSIVVLPIAASLAVVSVVLCASHSQQSSPGSSAHASEVLPTASL